ncbi:c-type cytochrome [Salinicola rhizosphaerae]|uniref:Cytochrome c n=1 Tax=Salinicola rhizosphaerae TaxID=1443141 RepID=A0ABQ3DPI2_9GAMM|nr:cytochrome c [Salinicola rhizosphaerae]GHB07416.1 cytochrome c [Salinicola rhizosphaerae]
MTHRIWFHALLGCGLLGATGAAMAANSQSADSNAPAQTAEQRGAYLARAGDCVACHTAPDGKPFAGGLKIDSPFGAIISTNITPDPDAGIGNYTRDQFAAALREGKRADGANLYPAMPYPSYAKLTDEDIDALYAYFMNGVEPVSEKAPESDLSFPFNQRWGISLWNWVFADADAFEPEQGQSDEVARGAYLVEGLGHCGSCHTPRGFAYQETALDGSDDAYLSGAALGDWWAPNLRGSGEGSDGLQGWSANDIAEYLATGRNAHSAVTGEMTSVIANSTSHLTDDDLQAIAAYLKSLQPAAEESEAKQSQTTPDQTEQMLTAADVDGKPGARLYLDNCAACHFASGKGAPQVFPSLVGNSLVNADDPSGMLHVILAGARLPSTPKKPEALAMPDFGWRLSDEEAAQLATFVRGAWGNHGDKVTADQVAHVRDNLPEQKESSKPDFQD